jgi:hypothetical protein
VNGFRDLVDEVRASGRCAAGLHISVVPRQISAGAFAGLEPHRQFAPMHPANPVPKSTMIASTEFRSVGSCADTVDRTRNGKSFGDDTSPLVLNNINHLL